MDMSVRREGSFARRLMSGEGFTSTSHVFVMEWAAILRDLVVSLLIAGAIAAWVQDTFWQHFCFADLLILPILSIYRKYYGARMTLFLLGTLYAAMVVAGYVVEMVFGGLGLVPDQADAKVPTQGVTWNYTTVLNMAFLLLAAMLLWRFLRTGGAAMLRMMDSSRDDAHPGPHDHGHSSSGAEHDGPPHHRPPHDRP